MFKELTLSNVTNQLLGDIRAYDSNTYGHCIRVGLLVFALANKIGLTIEDANEIANAGFVHDYGKTFISKDVLNKEGVLTDEEFALIRNHVQFGVDFLKSMQVSAFTIAAVSMHHENVNGGGYPKGIELQSEYGRILAIADMYDALTHARSYKIAFSAELALYIIDKDKDIRFKEKEITALNELIKEDKFDLDGVYYEHLSYFNEHTGQRASRLLNYK